MTKLVSNRRSFMRDAALASLALCTNAWAAAQTLMLKSLQIVVPTPAGSQPDLIARWIAEPFGALAGVTAVVTNMPGAAGAIAADAVLRREPASGPLLLAGLDHLVYSHLNSDRRPLDPFVDFTPVAAVNRDNWVVVTSTETSLRSLNDLAERAAREPINYASTGEGSTAHLLTAALCRALGVQAQHIAYSTPWMPDLIAGRIQFVVAPTPAVLPQLRDGRLRALATLTDERLPLPGTPPSIRELGSPQLIFQGGLFLFAPAALAPLVPQLNAWFVQVATSPDIQTRYRNASIETLALDVAATGAMVRQRLQLVDGMRNEVFGRAR